MDNIKNLQEALKLVLLDRTLSVETLDAVKEIQANNIKLQEANTNLGIDLAAMSVKVVTLNEKLTAHSIKEETLAKRILGVLERETKITALEQSAAVAQAESKVFNMCFDKVFRNISVNKSIVSNIPVGVNGGPTNSGFVSNYPASSVETETAS